MENAIADKLILSEPAEGDEGGEVYSIPEPEKIEKGDHDWYCFHCHLGGPTVKCEDCPRVFHLDCLPEDRKPNKDLFVCPPCHVCCRSFWCKLCYCVFWLNCKFGFSADYGYETQQRESEC